MRRSTLPDLTLEQIAALPALDRYVYELAIKGMTQAEIADRCNRSPGFVAYRISKLRDQFSDDDGGNFERCPICKLRMIGLKAGRMVRDADHECLAARARDLFYSGRAPVAEVEGHEILSNYRKHTPGGR